MCRLVTVLDGTLTEDTRTTSRALAPHTHRFHPPGCWPELVNATAEPATALVLSFRP
ncbi:hypothetical protein [Streptomyces cavernae]|uniref:hypothetical protein n=1 Tax=Streptomyces cavernae TaxID=2259034 RepID=UPI0012D99E0E|nr:hypothetical protein [Streptomyces cavernae]